MTGIVRLYNFRNYDSFQVEFRPGINVVIGNNGRGKTNLLEALFFLLQGRSMRTGNTEEMLKHGEEEGAIEGNFNLGREVRIKAIITRETKDFRNSIMDELQAVSFQPDDIWMVKSGPEARRKYLDEAAMDIKKGYRETLREYQRVLKQRNEAIRAVKKGIKGREHIRNWNPLLYKYGSSVVFERKQTARALEAEMARLGSKWNKGDVELKYYTSMGEWINDEKKTLVKIERMEEAEIRRGISLMGPHRDELLILLGGRNVRRECSQGEQKLVTIMWRMAQARSVEEWAGKKTLLLMDDCLSELDEGNRDGLMREFGEWEQVMITATDDMPEFERAHKIHLETGLMP